MKHKCLSTLSLALVGATAAFSQAALNTSPSRIVGHPNPEQLGPLASSNPNLVEGRELYNPEGIALDTTSSPPILYVSDTGNNRVLAWKNANSFINGGRSPTADLVIGQADFFSTNPQGPSTAFSAGLSVPTGVAVDSKGNLYVVDSGNNRILRFPKPFAQQVVTPDLVIGQSSFTANTANAGGTISAKGFSFGGAVANLAFSPLNGDLLATDPGNRRVLGFRASDLTPNNNGPSAYIEIGQNDSTSVQTALNANLAASLLVKSQFAVPRGIAFDSTGRLYVTDYDSSAKTLCTTLTGRVLVFDAGSVATRASASWIYGVGSVTTSDQANRGCLFQPTGVITLPDGTVGVVESGSSRILFFPGVNNFPTDGSAPLAIQSSVSGSRGLIGHQDFTNRFPNDWQGSQFTSLTTPPATASNLYNPVAAAYSGSELFIADTGNSRVLAMPQLTSPYFGAATGWLGQDRSDENSINLIEGREFNLQADAGLAVDSTGSTPHLYVADQYNHRVLGFRDLRTLKAGNKADLVIGQPDMQTALCNYPSGNPSVPSSSSLCGPIGVLVDSNGNLYVADSGNGRVLRFPAPFSQTGTGMPQADLVLGKQSFTDTISDPSSRTLHSPYGLAFSGINGLLVSDAAYNRVLFYPFTDTVNATFTPGVNGVAATVVFGQPNFTSITTSPSTGPTPTTLTYPRHIASDTSGRVYVADTGNNRVQIFGDPHSPNTAPPMPSFPITGLSAPRGVFVSSNTGEIWVANTNNGTCLKYPQFDILQFSGIPLPTSVPGVNDGYATLAAALDQYGDLFVADASDRVAIYYPAVTAVNGANFLPGRALAPGVLASVCAGDSNYCQSSSSHRVRHPIDGGPSAPIV